MEDIHFNFIFHHRSAQKTLPMSAKETITNVDKKPVTINNGRKPQVDVGQIILLIDID